MATKKTEAVEASVEAIQQKTPARYHVRALPAKGFRRAGRWWPSGAGVEVAASALSEAQVAAILAEPMLAVVAIVGAPAKV